MLILKQFLLRSDSISLFYITKNLTNEVIINYCRYSIEIFLLFGMKK